LTTSETERELEEKEEEIGRIKKNGEVSFGTAQEAKLLPMVDAKKLKSFSHSLSAFTTVDDIMTTLSNSAYI